MFFMIFLFNSCIPGIMPVSGHINSARNGNTGINVSGALIGDKDDFQKNDTEVISSSLSLWKKSDKNTTYEFYFLGARRTDEIYQNGLLYLDIFTSVYYTAPTLGGNLGFTTGLNFKYTDIYASLTADGLMYVPVLGDEDNEEIIFYSHLRPAMGITFNFDKISLFMEGSFIANPKTYKGDDDYIKDEFKDKYMIYLGILYSL